MTGFGGRKRLIQSPGNGVIEKSMNDGARFEQNDMITPDAIRRSTPSATLDQSSLPKVANDCDPAVELEPN